MTLQDTTEVLTKLADHVDTWMRHGVQPPLPNALVLAAERITAAMKICRPTAPIKQMPISQLVVSLVVPGEDVTAKDLWNRLARCGWDTTNRAISVALHRAAVRGVFERPRRGVYRLVAAENGPELANSKLPTDGPSASTRERGHTYAVANVEKETPM
jgi:hypothetical protein